MTCPEAVDSKKQIGHPESKTCVRMKKRKQHFNRGEDENRVSHAHCNSIAAPEATGERAFWGSINEEHEVPCRSTISNVIKRHNFFFRADTKPFKRRSKSGVRAFERRRVKGKAELWLRNENITQLWTRPRTPKDKPCVERMIGTLQTECLDYLIGPMSVSELQAEIDSWLKKYHSYRPHESLGFLTPHEFLNNFMSHSSTAVSLS